MSRMPRSILALLFCLAAVFVVAAPAAAQGRGFGQAQAGSNGRKARSDQAPPMPGALHGQAAVDALRGPLGNLVVELGGDLEKHAALLGADESAWITVDGQLMFVDVLEQELDAAGDPVPDESSAATGPPPTPLFLLPNGMPVHHSKASAPWTIYLDFDGEFVRSNAWGIFGRFTQGLTIDADPSTFNVDEQAVISRTWGRVAEDWAPFNVDVTTERPAVIGNTVLWSIIGRNPGDLGFPSNVGGVSLFDSNFGYVPFGLQTPVFIFWGVFGATDHAGIADTISQEDGHMFGLLHDGVQSGSFNVEYYTGHGTGATSWGPIMGSPSSRNVTQWSRGEYPGAINLGFGSIYPAQDDIAIIAGKLGFRADDFADDIAGAGPLAQPTTGIITSTTDVDVFALPPANEVHIEITPFRAGELTDGGNLDVAAEILNDRGVVVASVDDVEETAATLTVDLPSGQHYLRVRPSSNPANYTTYDSLGAYTITGTFVLVVKVTAFDEPLRTTVFTRGRSVPVKFTLTDAVAAARVLLSNPGAAPEDALEETSCSAQTGGRQHCNLKLPATLLSGATYWITAQYQDIDGRWVTPQAPSGVATPNPVPIVVN